ncbi:hypothetical protein A2Z33_02215 [Candidatus Gottesmanbacteria bacterium RBG_16_52_11]|uniref:Uncharacterized protein n=1 Tax=Candidatus Gottesmanbacteria bacterium RBG_16_52_11 TaxID=1798374 RepID=A0A1F5YQW4_9BACT|nr:MAG: hypothetical protein A2Z33_02215 [Candidatus Gottesmanbacteria bacterium RBG_16_52_11]
MRRINLASGPSGRYTPPTSPNKEIYQGLFAQLVQPEAAWAPALREWKGAQLPNSKRDFLVSVQFVLPQGEPVMLTGIIRTGTPALGDVSLRIPTHYYRDVNGIGSGYRRLIEQNLKALRELAPDGNPQDPTAEQMYGYLGLEFGRLYDRVRPTTSASDGIWQYLTIYRDDLGSGGQKWRARHDPELGITPGDDNIRLASVIGAAKVIEDSINNSDDTDTFIVITPLPCCLAE